LRQRAEQRRRDDDLREQLNALMASKSGAEFDQAVYDKFLSDLTVEVGALPPIERLIEAIQLADSLEPDKIGQQIRTLYRRRPRPAAVPG